MQSVVDRNVVTWHMTVLGATVQNLVVMANWHLVIVCVPYVVLEVLVCVKYSCSHFLIDMHLLASC